MDEFAGYKRTRIPPSKEAVNASQGRDRVGPNTFDDAYMKGRFPKWIRRHTAVDMEDTDHHDGGTAPRPTLTPQPYDGLTRHELEFSLQVRPDVELPYVDALEEFFTTHIGLWPGTLVQKEWLSSVMLDRRSQHDIAKAEGVTQAAVSLGRSRAVEKFIAHMGGKEALAEKLRQYLADKDAQDGGSRLHYLPRWVHG